MYKKENNYNIYIINNNIYIILIKKEIKDIEKISIIKKNDKYFLLIEFFKEKEKINLSKYIDILFNTDVENNILKKKIKNRDIDIKNMTMYITDINEFNKDNKGMSFKIHLKNI